MKHTPKAGCSAQDIYLTAGGLACGRCGASSVPVEQTVRCNAMTSDNKPCPLDAERAPGLCWIHAYAEDPERNP